MKKLITEVTDYSGQEGSVAVHQTYPAQRADAGLSEGPHICLNVIDHENEAIVYLNMEQAAKIVQDILSAMRKAKHGPQTD